MGVTPVSDNEFDKEVLGSSTPVLVDFWAEWCGPCKQLMPVIEEISGEISGVAVKKVNIDQNPESPQKYGVRGIPTLMIFKDGKVIGTKVGALPKSKLVEWINSVVAA
jgi:thioredoxin 1